MKTVRITELGMLLALALVFSYFESLIPVFIAVPGVKIGLANIITIMLLYRTNWKCVMMFMTVRVVLAGFLFSGVSGIVYSFVGGLCCIIIMSILKHFPHFSLVGVSITGAIFHNFGQIIVAVFVMENVHILYYLLVLCISGAISGLLVGYLAFLLLKRFNKTNL